MAKQKLNPLTDTPTSLADLTKDFMLNYIKVKGTEKDKEWFKKTANKYKTEEENRVGNGGKCFCISDIKALRQEYAERFFPQLLKSKNNWFDDIDNL